jgi:hypothetical protein
MGKNLVWFGEIERKLAKLSMTTFAYRSSATFIYRSYSYLFYGLDHGTIFCPKLVVVFRLSLRSYM